MKKLLFLLLILSIVSCSDDVILSKEEYNKLTSNVVLPEYPKKFNFKDKKLGIYDWNIYLGEDLHEYLSNDGGNSLIVIHYPDCKKCLSKDSIK